MKPRERDKGLLKEEIRKELGLSEESRFYFEIPISSEYRIRADMIIEDENERILIELCRTASWDRLSHLVLIRDLYKHTNRIFLAGRVIPDSIQRAADQLNIGIIHIPDNIHVGKDDLRPRGKLSSEKAWRIILHLIENGPCSMRSISISKKISYGWTHGVISNLISREIVDRKGNLVEISDMQALMNAVAWERPMRDMEELEITTSFDSTHDLARTLTDWSRRRNASTIMCGYIAATLHFGLGVRSDLVQCYLDDRRILELMTEEFSSKRKDGIKLKLFTPDRNLYEDSVVVDNIRITSREQTVLDVAGFGYSGRDLLIEMVKQYGTDST